MRRLGFYGSVTLPAIGKAGGFCLFWKFGVNVRVLNYSGSIIEVLVGGEQGKSNWVLFYTYGPPYAKLKPSFWNGIADRVLMCGKPWLILGDLNVVMNQHEKYGGKAFSQGDAKNFLNFLGQSDGVDLGCSGGHYTWQNKRDTSTLVKERLDKAVCDSQWCIEYPRSGLLNLPIIGSDHAPILLDTFLECEKLSFPFRFLTAWCRDDSCEEVIQNAWNCKIGGSHSFRLMVKTNNTKKALRTWNKEVFGRCDVKLKNLKNRLSWLQNHSLS